MRNNMSIMDYYNNNSDRNADNDKNKGFNVLQQVNLNSLIGKGLLYGSVDFAFLNQKETWMFFPLMNCLTNTNRQMILTI